MKTKKDELELIHLHDCPEPPDIPHVSINLRHFLDMRDTSVEKLRDFIHLYRKNNPGLSNDQLANIISKEFFFFGFRKGQTPKDKPTKDLHDSLLQFLGGEDAPEQFAMAISQEAIDYINKRQLTPARIFSLATEYSYDIAASILNHEVVSYEHWNEIHEYVQQILLSALNDAAERLNVTVAAEPIGEHEISPLMRSKNLTDRDIIQKGLRIADSMEHPKTQGSFKKIVRLTMEELFGLDPDFHTRFHDYIVDRLIFIQTGHKPKFNDQGEHIGNE